MKRFEKRKSGPYIQAAIAITTLAVFVADLLTPLGVAAWIFYLVPLSLCLFDWRPRVPLLAATLATVCLIIGYITSSRSPEFPVAVVRLNRLFALVTMWAVAAAVRQFIVAKLNLREQDWIRSGQRELSLRMQGELSLGQLGDNILRVLCHHLESPVAVLYVAEEDGARFRRQASYAVGGARPAAPDLLSPGDSLLGQAIKERRIVRMDQLPAGYLAISSALGRTAANHLVLVPAEVDSSVLCAMEFGFLHPIGRSDIDLLQRVVEPIATAVRSAQYRMRQMELLTQTQQQAEELQAQQEELRVANEELEEQSRALKESQARLEGQQAELEQTNAQLEQQAAELQKQRDAMARTQVELVDKAEALERSNQYKSEFLANMSHELRTPLNSALILAKLLADNKEGNLTPEQVKFASTICSSGQDLLTLINDILDLSRIEAGRVDMRPEEVAVSSLFASLKKTFLPLAAQKGLGLDFATDADAPSSIKTDNLRLQQILRNLLSNAIKFTEKGQVSLRVSRAPGGQMAFAVQDTGIGVPHDQQEAIFDAFHQANGSTSRKYGGTGLGLTISRELARRMGGTLTVQSERDKGSTFTLRLPPTLEAAAEPAAQATPVAPRPVEPVRELPAPSKPATAAPTVDDDRELVAQGDRTILVIEDDARFAAILRDLARELRFRCLVATTAGEGLQLAERFVPGAILLDVHLPDLSGLGLLEQIKRNPATRHIPVHVVSVADYTQQALEMGAIGYALKPVKREQIVGAIERLEKKLEQRVRRILIVEDVAAQREGIEALLRGENVEIVSVGRGQEALDLLRTSTFDCMVLDLILPDMSGYALLEKMAAGEAFSFPPVIVYTGRALTREEEGRLRKYASSVIIKGARSPERLLDEVSLFLHQVEAKLPRERQRILQAVRQREAAFEGRAILVVEDDARNIFAVSSVLEPKGCKLLIARNGREALDVLDNLAKQSSDTVDLVLMDIMMPVMDGLTATREIRKRPEWRKLPIIALTAKAMADDRTKCIEAGANDYIAKPLDVDKLVSLVKVWLPK